MKVKDNTLESLLEARAKMQEAVSEMERQLSEAKKLLREIHLLTEAVLS